KLFVTASPEVRAKRRFLELSEAGADVTEAGVLEDVIARDKRDAERETSPMVQAEDAVLIDTSDLSIDEAVARAVAVVEERRAAG
ncbi:MAG: (d)CMP kinase, partial [Planctomycetota bacterium]